MFGGGDRVAERRVHHNDALHRCSGNVDIVDADPGAADNFQVGRFLDEFFRQLRRRTDSETIILADDFAKFFGCFAGDDIDVTAALAENLFGFRVHLVGNEYAWFCHDFDP